MAKPRNRDPNRPKKQPKPGQHGGYCDPPESGKIKPGEVRNPWGPKGKPKPVPQDPFEIAMNQMTKSNINGKPTDITVELGIHLVHAQKALAGSTASYNALIRARPGRGQRFETAKLIEDQRQQQERDEQTRETREKVSDFFEDYARMKRQLGERDCNNPDDRPDAPS